MPAIPSMRLSAIRGRTEVGQFLKWLPGVALRPERPSRNRFRLRKLYKYIGTEELPVVMRVRFALALWATFQFAAWPAAGSVDGRLS